MGARRCSGFRRLNSWFVRSNVALIRAGEIGADKTSAGGNHNIRNS